MIEVDIPRGFLEALLNVLRRFDLTMVAQET
jgi:hypothetical protein